MVIEKTIYDLHEEHKTWLNKLAFYKDDMQTMQNRISEIASKNTAQQILAQVEHFQNQFIIQKEQMDILHHVIGEHESELEAAVNKNDVAIDHRHFPDHTTQREAMESFETIFTALRKELIHFASQYM